MPSSDVGFHWIDLESRSPIYIPARNLAIGSTGAAPNEVQTDIMNSESYSDPDAGRFSTSFNPEVRPFCTRATATDPADCVYPQSM